MNQQHFTTKTQVLTQLAAEEGPCYFPLRVSNSWYSAEEREGEAGRCPGRQGQDDRAQLAAEAPGAGKIIRTPSPQHP